MGNVPNTSKPEKSCNLPNETDVPASGNPDERHNPSSAQPGEPIEFPRKPNVPEYDQPRTGRSEPARPGDSGPSIPAGDDEE